MVDIAEVYQAQNDYETAQKYFKNAFELDNNKKTPSIYYNYGRFCYQSLEDFNDKAIKYLNISIEIAKKSSDIDYHRSFTKMF